MEVQAVGFWGVSGFGGFRVPGLGVLGFRA